MSCKFAINVDEIGDIFSFLNNSFIEISIDILYNQIKVFKSYQLFFPFHLLNFFKLKKGVS
jgi:hypothetical protein